MDKVPYAGRKHLKEPQMTRVPGYPSLLSPDRVAKIYGVDIKTVGRWADSGRFTIVRTPGGHRRFIEDEILEQIDKSTTRPTPTEVTSDASEAEV